MPQLCKICRHPQREAIDAELLRFDGRSYRAIGGAYGASKDSLARHYFNHIPPAAREKRVEELVAARAQAEERYVRILESIRLQAPSGAEGAPLADQDKLADEITRLLERLRSR
jgi:hypothetical protein